MPGQGSIFQRADGRWVAQLSIGGRVGRRFLKRIRKTRREATEALDQLRAGHASGQQPSRLTVGAYLEQWVRDARNIRPSTRHGYEAVIRYHLAPTIGHVRLVALTPPHVEAMLATVDERLSPKSLRNVHAVLRRALGQAQRAGLVARNVASREFVDAPRVPVEEPRALSADEVRRFLVAASDDRLAALFVLAIGTGLRQGELLGLAWEDLDLDRQQLHVRRELVRRGGKYQRAELKTPRSRRVVPLAPSVVAALSAHRDRVIEAGFIPIGPGPIFTSLKGTPLSGSWLTHHFYDLLLAARIPRLPFKNLRTTFSSRLFEAGIPDRRLADLMGHTRTSTTHGHYIATEGAAQDAALAAVERLIG
jgi:integrase